MNARDRSGLADERKRQTIRSVVSRFRDVNPGWHEQLNDMFKELTTSTQKLLHAHSLAVLGLPTDYDKNGAA